MWLYGKIGLWVSALIGELCDLWRFGAGLVYLKAKWFPNLVETVNACHEPSLYRHS